MPADQKPNGHEWESFLKPAFTGETLAPRYEGHLPVELIGAYIAGELDEADKMSVAAHLNSCPQCLNELNELRVAWERLTDRLSSALPQPSALFEESQKLEIARQAKGFLARHQPEALELFDEIWRLLSAKPLREIARARPQLVRGEPSSGRIGVAVLASLAAILTREHVRHLSEVPSLRLRELMAPTARECGLSFEWAEKLEAYLNLSLR